MKKTIFVLCIVCLIFACGSGNPYSEIFASDLGSTNDSINVRTDLPWSIRLAESFIFRHPGSVTYDEHMTSDKWNYEQGVVLEGLRQVWLKTDDERYFDFIKNNIDQYVDDSGVIKTYKYSDFNLDNINTGRQVLFLYKKTHENKYKVAVDTLRKQLENQPRTKAGGFWHKKIYPYQMWLDGIYMGSPFYAEYTKMFGSKKDFDDITLQILTVYKNTVDKKTGLLYHAWDESKTQKWADPKTGKAPNFWGRAIGWYVMAIVDVLDYLPEDHPDRAKIIKILQNVSDALLKVRDTKSGLWYQVLDKGNKEGNYLEASCATMFTYAFAKGANKGYLNKKYLEIAKESFNSILKYHVVINDNGFIDLLHTCRGAGLGGNPYRDGTFEYYISEPQRTNDFKGYGPLIMSAVELEKACLIK